MTWRSIRCFWKLPFGHRWAVANTDTGTVLRCNVCRKEKRGSQFSIPEGGGPKTAPGQYTGSGQ
jgi:hypothetical protein